MPSLSLLATHISIDLYVTYMLYSSCLYFSNPTVFHNWSIICPSQYSWSCKRYILCLLLPNIIYSLEKWYTQCALHIYNYITKYLCAEFSDAIVVPCEIMRSGCLGINEKQLTSIIFWLIEKDLVVPRRIYNSSRGSFMLFFMLCFYFRQNIFGYNLCSDSNLF